MNCQSCGAVVVGNYCEHCGRKIVRVTPNQNINMNRPTQVRETPNSQPSSNYGKQKGIAALILGISSVVLPVFGLLGIVGLVLAISAKQDGYICSLRTTAFVLNVIGIGLSVLAFVCFLSVALYV